VASLALHFERLLGFWHIALLAGFMAKANYPENMPALPWTKAGTDYWA
jgi:hypothetical protein